MRVYETISHITPDVPVGSPDPTKSKPGQGTWLAQGLCQKGEL